MSFAEQLSELMGKIPGAIGIILADWEGETVDRASRMDDYQLRVLGAHKGVILMNLREALKASGDDELREVVITTEEARILILPVTDEYFLVLLLERRQAPGKALFEARSYLEILRKEIA